MQKLILSLVSVSLLACGTAEPRRDSPAAQQEPQSAAPSSLIAAHEAYLGGDFVATGERVRDVLLDPTASPLARENALELLDKTYETNGTVPTRFVYPAGFEGISFGAMHGRNTYSDYRSMFLWMRVKEGMGARIGNISVRHLPDDAPLFDRATKNAHVKIRHDKPGFDDVVLDSWSREALPPDGVFGIRIELDGKPVVDTWLIAQKLESSAAPEVAVPGDSTIVTEETPTVRFTPFRSPEGADIEERTLSVFIEEEGTKKKMYDYWTNKPAELGGQHRVTSKLANGSYYLAFTASEQRKFGPIAVVRSSQTGVRFSVAR